MAPVAQEPRFEILMSELVARHGAANQFRVVEARAEIFLAEGLAIADAVRRAARRGLRERPSQEDCSRLAEVVSHLDELAKEGLATLAASGLREALATSRLAEAADLACHVFASLEPAEPPPEHGYLAFPLRRHARGGESLLHPMSAARETALVMEKGLAPPEPADDSLDSIARPIVLLPEFAACDSEVAIEVAQKDIQAPLLRHRPSGELWVFAARLPGPFVVTISSQADDEWWAASPIRYESYAIGLRQALDGLGIAWRVIEAPHSP